jgi:hypothetical protein
MKMNCLVYSSSAQAWITPIPLRANAWTNLWMHGLNHHDRQCAFIHLQSGDWIIHARALLITPEYRYQVVQTPGRLSSQYSPAVSNMNKPFKMAYCRSETYSTHIDKAVSCIDT